MMMPAYGIAGNIKWENLCIENRNLYIQNKLYLFIVTKYNSLIPYEPAVFLAFLLI
jgi:hypothetical protein